MNVDSRVPALGSSDPTAIDIKFDPTIQHMNGWTTHKHMHFSVPFVTEIAENLWQGGCQTGLVLPKNIKHLVSLYVWEHYEVKHELDSSLSVEMYDSL